MIFSLLKIIKSPLEFIVSYYKSPNAQPIFLLQPNLCTYMSVTIEHFQNITYLLIRWPSLGSICIKLI